MKLRNLVSKCFHSEISPSKQTLRRIISRPNIINKTSEMNLSDFLKKSSQVKDDPLDSLNDKFSPAAFTKEESSIEAVLDEEIGFPLKILGIEHEMEENVMEIFI